jgi:hypothetical protein
VEILIYPRVAGIQILGGIKIKDLISKSQWNFTNISEFFVENLYFQEISDKLD